MATTPVPTPAPKPSTPVVEFPLLTKYITFLKAHEKLLIVGFAGLLLFHAYSKTIDAWVNHDKAAAVAAAQRVKTDTTETAALNAKLAVLQAQVAAQNAVITAKIKTSQIVTKKQQQTDATLSPTDLSARIAKLINVPPVEITPAAIPGELTFNADASVKTAQQLELVPQLQAEVAGDTTIIANDNTIIATQAALITQLNKDITDEKASHAKDVSELKSQNHKSWLNGFKWGFVTGVTLGLVVHHGSL